MEVFDAEGANSKLRHLNTLATPVLARLLRESLSRWDHPRAAAAASLLLTNFHSNPKVGAEVQARPRLESTTRFQGLVVKRAIL